MTTTKYYFYPYGTGKGRLHRIVETDKALITERWEGDKGDNGEWAESNTVLDVLGFASNADLYERVTKAEADKMIEDGTAV